MFSSLPFLLFLPFLVHAAVNLDLPAKASSTHVVHSNFIGISIELSFLNLYTGNSSSSLNQQSINYFSAVTPTNGQPLRIRVGGNSMDSSSMDPVQPDMIKFTGTRASDNDVHCTYGPTLFDTLKAFGDAVGGAEYMLGLSLRDPNNTNNPLVVAAAEKELGKSLDVFLLGNEPDLYTGHGNRPNLVNYTTENYFDDFEDAQNLLRKSSSGDLLKTPVLGGPTSCCRWNLDALLDDGFVREFADTLKYVTLQHYPQHNCYGTPRYGLDYYLKHDEVVKLAAWQLPGIRASIAANKPVVMTEFNTASCGGIPGISDTFAATLWTVDYSLQMASIGYTAAYIHTREANVTYTLFYEDNGQYVTRPAYYALPPLVAALTPNKPGSGGSTVVDLNLNAADSVAGYAIHDQNSSDSSPDRLVLFNYATSGSQTFHLSSKQFALGTDLPKGFGGTPEKVVRVRYLSAPSPEEKTNITWAGRTLAGVGNGKFVKVTSTTAAQNATIPCTNDCDVVIPGPGMAVVWLELKVSTGSGTLGDSDSSSTSNSSSANTSSASPIIVSQSALSFTLLASIIAFALTFLGI